MEEEEGAESWKVIHISKRNTWIQFYYSRTLGPFFVVVGWWQWSFHSELFFSQVLSTFPSFFKITSTIWHYNVLMLYINMYWRDNSLGWNFKSQFIQGTNFKTQQEKFLIWEIYSWIYVNTQENILKWALLQKTFILFILPIGLILC